MTKQRLDKALVARGMVPTRSQAENWVRLGRVRVDGQIVQKPGYYVADSARIALVAPERYVSRAGLKLASVAAQLHLNFQNAVVLDVGSSTGGFTDYALQHGAARVYAVDVGTDQLHPSLRDDPRIRLFEKTDIRDFTPDQAIDIVVIDVSFISVREILPHITRIASPSTHIVVMVKPQFEAGKHQVSKGVIKNDAIRREILAHFEQWVRQYCTIRDKRDSDIAGAKGNRERFYLLHTVDVK